MTNIERYLNTNTHKHQKPKLALNSIKCENHVLENIGIYGRLVYFMFIYVSKYTKHFYEVDTEDFLLVST